MLFALSKIPTLRQAQGRLSRANSAREMGHPVFSRLWWGQESGHEYSCSPYGTRALLPPNPALSCRAITDRRILTGDANALRISALNRLANARNGLDERPEGRQLFYERTSTVSRWRARLTPRSLPLARKLPSHGRRIPRGIRRSTGRMRTDTLRVLCTTDRP
jgi:hypothetical protein